MTYAALETVRRADRMLDEYVDDAPPTRADVEAARIRSANAQSAYGRAITRGVEGVEALKAAFNKAERNYLRVMDRFEDHLRRTGSH